MNCPWARTTSRRRWSSLPRRAFWRWRSKRAIRPSVTASLGRADKSEAPSQGKVGVGFGDGGLQAVRDRDRREADAAVGLGPLRGLDRIQERRDLGGEAVVGREADH